MLRKKVCRDKANGQAEPVQPKGDAGPFLQFEEIENEVGSRAQLSGYRLRGAGSADVQSQPL